MDGFNIIISLLLLLFLLLALGGRVHNLVLGSSWNNIGSGSGGGNLCTIIMSFVNVNLVD